MLHLWLVLESLTPMRQGIITSNTDTDTYRTSAPAATWPQRVSPVLTEKKTFIFQPELDGFCAVMGSSTPCYVIILCGWISYSYASGNIIQNCWKPKAKFR